jgi:dihydroxyacetone kinase-like predicted kinase
MQHEGGLHMEDTQMNGYRIYHSFLSGYMSLKDQREYLNKINVFPVADGDTGNNLVRTIKLIVRHLEPHRSATKVLNRIADLSLESARGNSGLIFSQYLNGLAINTKGKDSLTIHDFAEAAKKSVQLAYEAMETPVEGTILTVLSAW